MNKLSPAHIFSAFFIVVIQVLLLKNIQVAVLDRYVISAFIYPLIIIVLPYSMPRSIVLTIAFFVGIIVDVGYDSIGLHTSALVLTAFLRYFVLLLIEPRSGYGENAMSLVSSGMPWFLRYSAIMLAIHVFTYFSFDAFTFVFIGKILVNTLLSFAVSFLLVNLYSMIFRG
jgi:hypothetical protein